MLGKSNVPYGQVPEIFCVRFITCKFLSLIGIFSIHHYRVWIHLKVF
jgi:hypothetical protein